MKFGARHPSFPETGSELSDGDGQQLDRPASSKPSSNREAGESVSTTRRSSSRKKSSARPEVEDRDMDTDTSDFSSDSEEEEEWLPSCRSSANESGK